MEINHTWAVSQLSVCRRSLGNFWSAYLELRTLKYTLSLMPLQLCVSTLDRRSRAALERTHQVVSFQLEPLHKSTRTRIKKWRAETRPGSPSTHGYCGNSQNDSVEISKNCFNISVKLCRASSGAELKHAAGVFLALSYAHWLPFSLQTATILIKAGHPQTRIYYCYWLCFFSDELFLWMQ